MKTASVILNTGARPYMIYIEKDMTDNHKQELLESLALALDCSSVNLYDIKTNEWLGSYKLPK